MPAEVPLDFHPAATIIPRMSGSPRSARLILASLGAILIVLGGMFSIFLWMSYARAQETRAWVPTPCVIIGSQVLTIRPSPNSPPAHRASVRYRYSFGGTARTGEKVRRVDGPSSARDQAEAVCARYPVGREATCFVNPADPGLAVLEHGTRAGLYTLWFPLLFVVGGAGMILAARRRGDHSHSSPENSP